MGRSPLLLIGAIGLFLLALQLETEAGAEGGKVPTLAELAGSYTYAGDRSKDESAIKAKSDTATADMGRMVLKRARSRLASSTRIAESLVITQKDGKVSFQSDDYVVAVPGMEAPPAFKHRSTKPQTHPSTPRRPPSSRC